MQELYWTEGKLVASRSPQLTLDSRFAFASVLDCTPLARTPRLLKIAEMIGGTPLIELPHEPGCAAIFGKAEFVNAFGTVKARPAIAMLLEDLRRDCELPLADREYLSYGGATFHNALAGLLCDTGARLTLYTGDFLSEQQRHRLTVLGAELILIDRNLGFYAIIEAAVYAAARAPLKRFLYQHVDQVALDIHYQTTGTELKAQLLELGRQGLSAMAFVGSIGTGGTLIGAARQLRHTNPSLQVFATTPAEQPYADPNPPNGKTKFAGSGGFGFGRRQPFVRNFEGVIDGHFSVSYRSALAASSEIADHVGITIGTSSAANWLAARHVARNLPENSSVVCILPSLIESHEIALAEEVRRGKRTTDEGKFGS